MTEKENKLASEMPLAIISSAGLSKAADKPLAELAELGYQVRIGSAVRIRPALIESRF